MFPLPLKPLAAGLAAATLIATGCGERPAAKAEDTAETAPAAVAKVKRQDLSRELVLTAEFRPFEEIELHSKVAGYVKKIYVDVGDRVRQGQLLAVLEVPELGDDLERAAAAKRRSEAELARARDEVVRSQSMHDVAHLSYKRLAAVIKSRPNLVAQQEIDDALARDRVADAQMSAAKSALAAAEQQVQVANADHEKVKTLLAYAQITAPFTGIITKRYADTGAMIQAGTASQTQTMPLVRLSRNQLLRLVAPVPESSVSHIRVGSRVEVRVPTLNRTFPGTVSRFSGSVQFATRTMETEVDVPNPDFVLMPGMFAEAVLTLDHKRDALSIPLQAISSNRTNPTVFVVNTQGKLEERKVRVGMETPDAVEVLTGLRADELVLIGSRGRFQPGDVVHPKLVEVAGVR